MTGGRFAKLVEDLRVYLTGPSIRMFFLGFSSGLPLLLVLGTLSFRLREAGVGLATIGFMSWIGLVYAMKWGLGAVCRSLSHTVSHEASRTAPGVAHRRADLPPDRPLPDGCD